MEEGEAALVYGSSMLLEFQTPHPVHPCTPDSVVGLYPRLMCWCLPNSQLLLAVLGSVVQTGTHGIPSLNAFIAHAKDELMR